MKLKMKRKSNELQISNLKYIMKEFKFGSIYHEILKENCYKYNLELMIFQIEEDFEFVIRFWITNSDTFTNCEEYYKQTNLQEIVKDIQTIIKEIKKIHKDFKIIFKHNDLRQIIEDLNNSDNLIGKEFDNFSYPSIIDLEFIN